MNIKKEKAFIFDLDGTLADFSQRLNLFKKQDYDQFHAQSIFDKLIVPVAMVLRSLLLGGHKIIIMTGRPEKYRKITNEWLVKNNVIFSKLLMRPDASKQHDYEIKQSYLKELQKKYIIIGAFEDRQQVVDMWRRNDIQCFQVNDYEI